MRSLNFYCSFRQPVLISSRPGGCTYVFYPLISLRCVGYEVSGALGWVNGNAQSKFYTCYLQLRLSSRMRSPVCMPSRGTKVRCPHQVSLQPCEKLPALFIAMLGDVTLCSVVLFSPHSTCTTVACTGCFMWGLESSMTMISHTAV